MSRKYWYDICFSTPVSELNLLTKLFGFIWCGSLQSHIICSGILCYLQFVNYTYFDPIVYISLFPIVHYLFSLWQLRASCIFTLHQKSGTLHRGRKYWQWQIKITADWGPTLTNHLMISQVNNGVYNSRFSWWLRHN